MDKIYWDKIYTGQNIYRTKYIETKDITGKIYLDKIYIGQNIFRLNIFGQKIYGQKIFGLNISTKIYFCYEIQDTISQNAFVIDGPWAKLFTIQYIAKHSLCEGTSIYHDIHDNCWQLT